MSSHPRLCHRRPRLPSAFPGGPVSPKSSLSLEGPTPRVKPTTSTLPSGFGNAHPFLLLPARVGPSSATQEACGGPSPLQLPKTPFLPPTYRFLLC